MDMANMFTFSFIKQNKMPYFFHLFLFEILKVNNWLYVQCEQWNDPWIFR